MPFLLNTNDHRGRQQNPIPHGAHAVPGREGAVPFAYGAPGRPRSDHSPSADLALNFRGHRFPMSPETTINPRQNSGGSHPSQDGSRSSPPYPLPAREGRVGATKGSDDRDTNTRDISCALR